MRLLSVWHERIRGVLRLASCILLSAAVVLAAGCKVTGDVESATIELERAYVPALTLSMIGQDEDAGRRAVEIYAKKWKKFMELYATAYPDQLWRDNLALVDFMVGDARDLAAGGRLMDAHVTLESVRQVFREYRETQHIETVMDHLAMFHTLVERASHIANDNRIMPDEAGYLRGIIPQMEAEWLNIEQSDFDRKAYGFTDETSDLFSARASVEREFLSHLAVSLAHGDERAILDTLVAIRRGYADVLKLFGDFAAVGR